MSVFEQRLSFRTLYNAGWGLKVLSNRQRVRSGALVGVQWVKPLKNFGFFTSGGQKYGLK